MTEISGAVSEIAGSAQEQSLNISEINSAISSLDQATQQNAIMVAEAANAGSALSQKANELDQCLTAFSGSTVVRPVSPETPTHASPARNQVAAQRDQLERSFGSTGSAAVKKVEPVESDWVEF